ncbi:MAG: hypothetical protein ABIH59_02270 [archaeon]
MKREINKAVSLGFFPNDCGTHNAILSLKDGKIYLIDFRMWEKD